TNVVPGYAPSVEAAEARLLAHAAECPACRPISARYQTLRHAIPAWRRPPAPPADLVRRVLSASEDLTPLTATSAAPRARGSWFEHRARIKLLSGLAAACLVCFCLAIALNRIVRHQTKDRTQLVSQEVVRHPRSVTDLRETPNVPPALDRALAD